MRPRAPVFNSATNSVQYSQMKRGTYDLRSFCARLRHDRRDSYHDVLRWQLQHRLMQLVRR